MKQYNVKITGKALADMEAIYDYIADELLNPDAAMGQYNRDAVIVPVYGDVMDEEALRILGEIYPEKEIVPVDGEILAVIGGGIHCVTQQQPIFDMH